ncbi:hypothetical protein [Paenibacillus sp. GYB003]|uniref:hypothetical protein n=1 Tax=Paenibacillus sp. GYB003 TaxID=2994392 RepID=UPI002F9632D2
MKSERFARIDAESLNIVDRDGTIRMTLFNNANIPPAMMDGKDFLPGHRQDWPISGIMFYNGEGDECGGLIFGSERREDGTYTSTASLTFDQYKQDEVVSLSYDNENGVLNYGITQRQAPYPAYGANRRGEANRRIGYGRGREEEGDREGVGREHAARVHGEER